MKKDALMARPREFDPEDALEKAMHQFWSKGYYDTSIRDLVTCTGVNYYGLYSVFKDKHGLFLASLDHYQKTITRDILSELDTTGPIDKVLQKTLTKVALLMKSKTGPVGCLMANTALEVAPSDSEVAAKVNGHRKVLERAFQKRLSLSQRDDLKRNQIDAEAVAEFLTTTVYTVGMLVRSGQNKAFVSRFIETSLRCVT